MDEKIKVSVCVVTYNQEEYISECLQSLVDQRTDFKFEIIVGEDCSTDSTRKIVNEFYEKYPKIIVRNFNRENVGAVKNIISTYRLARGKYICHVDGDDYALPYKLQKQFDALENNPSCVICSHDMLLVNSHGENSDRTFRKHDRKVNNLLDLYAQLPFFSHSSKMFLNDLDDDFWSNLHPEALDIEVHVEQVKKGNIFHIDEVLGAYRVFVGMSSDLSIVNPLIVKGAIRVFENELHSGYIDKDTIKRHYAKMMLEYSYQSALVDDTHGMISYLKKSISIGRYSNVQFVFEKLAFSPTLLVFLCKARSFFKGYRI